MSKFNQGRLVMTRCVADLIEKDTEFAKQVTQSLKRYANNDWGDLCDEDKEANDSALVDGDRLLGRYNLDPESIYIITEWDRSVTTILLPEEY